MGEDAPRFGMRYGGHGYAFDHYLYRPSFLVFNSRRAHETRILDVGKVETSRKLTFFFGAKNVNPYDNLLPYLNIEGVQEAREAAVKKDAARMDRRKSRGKTGPSAAKKSRK
jgi:hypothetical protein